MKRCDEALRRRWRMQQRRGKGAAPYWKEADMEERSENPSTACGGPPPFDKGGSGRPHGAAPTQIPRRMEDKEEDIG